MKVAHYLDTYLNLERWHSVLGYRSTHQFETDLLNCIPWLTVRFDWTTPADGWRAQECLSAVLERMRISLQVLLLSSLQNLAQIVLLLKLQFLNYNTMLDYVHLLLADSNGWNEFRKNNPLLIIEIYNMNVSNINFENLNLRNVKIEKCNLINCKIFNCDLSYSSLFDSNLSGSVISDSDFFEASLPCAKLNQCKIFNSKLVRCDMMGAEIKNSQLEYVDIRYSRLEDTDFSDSSLINCKVYGISAWSSKGQLNRDSSLIITPDYESEVVMKDLSMAQYFYMMHKKGVFNVHKINIFDPILAVKSYKYHVFISHASEDKDKIVRPLAHMLDSLGLSVWYDEMTLGPGDSLRASIDEGLAKSLAGVVLLSNNFFNKAWAKAELNAIFSLDIAKGKYLIPVWHEISHEEILLNSPLLADRFAIVDDGDINKLCVQILKAIDKITTPGNI